MFRLIRVALRKESVDRNDPDKDSLTDDVSSLSARRAWIEIRVLVCSVGFAFVALRKESVDRNTNFFPANLFNLVALRKESVDRN